jgi:hypothetical protein
MLGLVEEGEDGLDKSWSQKHGKEKLSGFAFRLYKI